MLIIKYNCSSQYRNEQNSTEQPTENHKKALIDNGKKLQQPPQEKHQSDGKELDVDLDLNLSQTINPKIHHPSKTINQNQGSKEKAPKISEEKIKTLKFLNELLDNMWSYAIIEQSENNIERLTYAKASMDEKEEKFKQKTKEIDEKIESLEEKIESLKEKKQQLSEQHKKDIEKFAELLEKMHNKLRLLYRNE